MIIFFQGIKGLDPNLAWEFDESKNYASCSLLVSDQTNQESNRKSVFKLPKGMVLDNNTLVIDDVKTFALKYPYTKSVPRKFENFLEKLEAVQDSSLVLNSMFAPRSCSHSNSGSNSSTEKSGKTRSKILNSNKLTAEDYPATLLLNDLINVDFNTSLRGETIAYRSLLIKRKTATERKAQYLKNNKSFTNPTELMLQAEQLKVALLDNIEEILMELNTSYNDFCQAQALSHEIRKELTDYCCRAIMQTMANGDFRKAGTVFQNLPKKQDDPLFNGNLEGFHYFNQQSLDLRIKALTFNWLVLINPELNLANSAAGTLAKETLSTLNQFRQHLQNNPTQLEKIEVLVKKLTPILLNLINAEQECEACAQNHHRAVESKEEKVNGYYSLKVFLTNFLNKNPMKPLPYNLHLVTQNGMASTILANLIKLFSTDQEFKQVKYEAYMADITIYDTNLYFSPEWHVKVQDCFEKIANEKKFQEQMAKLQLDADAINKVVSHIETKVYACFRSLLTSYVEYQETVEQNNNSSSSLLNFH